MKPTKSLALIIFVLSLLYACDNDLKNTSLDDFDNIKPAGWSCEIIEQNFDKNDIPKNAKDPIAIVKYTNTNIDINYLYDIKIKPSLILDLYPIAQKKELIEFIRSQQMYSWCIPIYYGETKNYFIISSPCFINNGTFTDQSKAAIDDLQNALNKIISKKEYDLIQN